MAWYKRYRYDTILNHESIINRNDYQYVLHRINYYNKISQPFEITDTAIRKSQFKLKSTINSFSPHRHIKVNSTYFFDSVSLLDYFSTDIYFDYVFGDVTTVPPSPAFVKSRPISGNNQNSVVLKLDALRHFNFIKDETNFTEKISCALFRGPCYQPHRQRFVEKCHALPQTNIGDIRKCVRGEKSYKSPMSLQEHLRYKYIISVEGNDVATNLKWIMSSNSLCFMTKPKYETWFMEGSLIPDHHYVLLKDDYSDLNEKIAYYDQHVEEALAIIDNAHDWVDQFRDKSRELLIGLLVMIKYFELSGQIACTYNRTVE